jgi:hypothetical protein
MIPVALSKLQESMATNPIDIEESKQAMDFIHGLDQGRYTVFKMNMLNSWAAGA